MQLLTYLCLDPCFKELTSDIGYMENIISSYNQIYDIAKKLKNNGWSLEVNTFDGVHIICSHPECFTEQDLVKKLQDQSIDISPDLAYFEVSSDELNTVKEEFFEEGDCGSGGCGFCACHD